jgi:hypothetical protein
MLSARRTFLEVMGASPAFQTLLGAQTTASLTERKQFSMEIKRNGSQPSTKGPPDWFTGTVRIDPLFQANTSARATVRAFTSRRR